MQSSEKGINVLKQSSLCCARESNSFTEHNVEEFVHKIWVGGDFEETGHALKSKQKAIAQVITTFTHDATISQVTWHTIKSQAL